MFAAHYFFLSAFNSQSAASRWSAESRAVVPRGIAPVQPLRDGSSHTRKKSQASSKFQRSHGALYQVDEGIFQYFGGYDGSARTCDTITYTANGAMAPSHVPPCVEAEARQFHTVTELADFACLLVGGRSAPGHGYSECWLRRHGRWSMVEPLPCPLYRHSATKIKFSATHEAVLVYGGKSSNELVSNAWFLWEEGKGWSALDIVGQPGSPRFSALFAALDSNNRSFFIHDHPPFANLPFGILAGGMAEDGTVVSTAFLWAVKNGQVFVKELLERLEGLRRFGAKLAVSPDRLCIVGGINRSGLGTSEDDFTTLPELDIPFWVEWSYPQADGANDWNGVANEPDKLEKSSLFFGHSVTWDGQAFITVGGGATCFTCGTYMNPFIWSLCDVPRGSQGCWKFVTTEARTEDDQQPTKRLKSYQTSMRTSSAKYPPAFRYPERKALGDDHERLTARMVEAKPWMLENAAIGPCTYLWTTKYLKTTIGWSRVLEVHECPEKHMVFASKNFSIKQRTCSEFIDAAVQGHSTYLRSISSRNRRAPACFQDDYPSLAADFRFPQSLLADKVNIHSSVLRISGQVNMWLHYDVSRPSGQQRDSDGILGDAKPALPGSRLQTTCSLSAVRCNTPGYPRRRFQQRPQRVCSRSV